MTTSQFVAPASSVTVVALALTPEMTNALSILLAAIFVGLVNLYMARTSRLVQMREVARVIAPVEAKIDALAPVVAKIDHHVNGEKTRAEGEVAAQKIQIDLQREMIAEMQQAAALLAQAKVTTDTATAVVTPRVD